MDKEHKKRLHEKTKHFKRKDYIEHHPNFSDVIERVWCKCGMIIKELKGDPTRKFQRDGKNYELAILAPVNGYQEVIFHFNDGTKHVTCMCGDCVKHLTHEKAECHYAADALKWEEEGWVKDWDRLLNRKIIAVEIP